MKWYDLILFGTLAVAGGAAGAMTYTHFREPVPEVAEGPYQPRETVECVCRPIKLVTRRPR